MTPLPGFTEHAEHNKLQPLDGPLVPEPFIQQWFAQATGKRDPSEVRVLDLGCGRGGTVAWLREQGYDAYGLDIDERYVANGQAYFEARGDTNRLSVLDGDRYPYPDDYFHIVFSDQVFEHVADLDQLAAEVFRVTAPHGLGLHRFPAKWTIFEPHMRTPFAHWLPKGRARKAAIKLALRAGLAEPHFSDYSLEDRAAIYSKFSHEETYYRSPGKITRTFGRAQFADAQFTRPSQDRVRLIRGGAIPRAAIWPVALAYRSMKQMYVTTFKG